MIVRACCLAACLLVGLAPAASAGTYRLDDSLTHTTPANVQMQWRPIEPGLRDSGMQAWVRVNVRIDTREWVGQRGQVYLVMERDDSSSITAEWTTEGRLLPGRIGTGQRTLVYSGTITTATLEDQFLMRLHSLADWRSDTRRLNFHFELDTQ